MKRYHNTAYINPRHRNALIDGYSTLISEQLKEGKDLYFLTFLFNNLPGNRSTQFAIMKSEIERVHQQLMRHIVRKPTSPAWQHLRPTFIVSPDFPVLKNEKVASNLHRANDGLHCHGAVLIPPRNPLPKGMNQHPFMLKQSRIHASLEQHFEEHRSTYLNPRLYRIDVMRVEYETMADYLLKAFKWGRASYDDILVLA